MSTIRYLIDYKNNRAFCLGDRYYSDLFAVARIFTLSEIEKDMFKANEHSSDLYTNEIARRLWAFCNVAGFDVGLRYDNTEYTPGQWGCDGFALVGSVWQCGNDQAGVQPDPCADAQTMFEKTC